MGQCWYIVDVDKRLQLLFLGKLGEICFTGVSEKIIQSIARPVPKIKPVQPHNPSTTGLFKLSYDILERVFFHLNDDLVGLVTLLMCNKSLFAIGFNSVHALFCNVTTCSARDRIICLGDLCQDIGLPDSILPEDLANYNEYLARNANDESTYASFAEETFQRLGAFLHLDIYFWLNRLGPNNYQYSLEWRDALEDVINLEYPSELDWILCNLTKRVYVTARAITERTGIQPRGPFFNAPINLTEILMFKICCSTDPSCSMTYPSPLHQGPWAADRFEITTMDWLDQLEVVKGRVEKDWEDVSEEAVKEIVEIVKSEYPSRWEQMITNPIKIEGVRDTAENLVG